MSAVQGAVGAGFSGDNIADGFVDCAVRAVRTLEIYLFFRNAQRTIRLVLARLRFVQMHRFEGHFDLGGVSSGPRSICDHALCVSRSFTSR